MSYNNTKLVAGLLGYALLACSISGCSFDSFSKTATETSSESSSSATEITYLNADDMFTDRDKEVGYDEDTATTITLSDNKPHGCIFTFTLPIGEVSLHE